MDMATQQETRALRLLIVTIAFLIVVLMIMGSIRGSGHQDKPQLPSQYVPTQVQEPGYVQV